MKTGLPLDSFVILLVRPRFAENLGAVARAMKNMSLCHLGIVNGCSPLHPSAYRLASGAEEILERAEEYPDLREAIAEMGCVVGTTCRQGWKRNPLLSPRDLLPRLIPLARENRIALVFGPEREGLRNEELSQCHLFVKIPSSTRFPSLNLAQAVMILCYELTQSAKEEGPSPGLLALAEDLERMFGHMEQTLVDIGFLDPRHPKQIMRTLRGLFSRSHLDPREVRILQGILSQMDWYAKEKHKAEG